MKTTRRSAIGMAAGAIAAAWLPVKELIAKPKPTFQWGGPPPDVPWTQFRVGDVVLNERTGQLYKVVKTAEFSYDGPATEYHRWLMPVGIHAIKEEVPLRKYGARRELRWIGRAHEEPRTYTVNVDWRKR